MQIESQKLKWSAQSKIGSLENKAHKAGGGEKKIESRKLNFKDSAQSKVGSRENMKHKAGGGDIQVCARAEGIVVSIVISLIITVRTLSIIKQLSFFFCYLIIGYCRHFKRMNWDSLQVT